MGGQLAGGTGLTNRGQAAARMMGVTDRLDLAVAAAEPVLASPSATPNLLRPARTGIALVAVVLVSSTGDSRLVRIR